METEGNANTAIFLLTCVTICCIYYYYCERQLKIAENLHDDLLKQYQSKVSVEAEKN